MKNNQSTIFTNKSNTPIYFKYSIRLIKTNPSQELNTSPVKHITTPSNNIFNKSFLKSSFSNNHSFDKAFTKGKFYKALNSNLIFSKHKVNCLNKKFKDNDLLHKQIHLHKKNIFNTNTKNNLNLLKSMKNSFRYEDVFLTPEEFLKKKFTPNEIDIMFKDPSSFSLDSEPFKSSKLKICNSLADIINKENKYKQNNKNNKSNTQYFNIKSKSSSPNSLSFCNSSSNYFNSSTVTTRSNNNHSNSVNINKNITKYTNNIQPIILSKPPIPQINSFSCKYSSKSQSSQIKKFLIKQSIYENNRIKYYQSKQQEFANKELLLKCKTNIKKQKIIKNKRDLLYTYDISKEIQKNYHTLSS